MLFRLSLVVLGLAILDSPLWASPADCDSIPTLRWNARAGGGDRLSVGLSYQQLVLQELQGPMAEIWFRPSPFFAVGYRRGHVATDHLPALFADAHGVSEGVQGRVYFLSVGHDPQFQVDFYLGYVQQRGSLPFSARLYLRNPPHTEPNARYLQATAVTGAVTFRQNELYLGMRIRPCRFLYVDLAVGYRRDRFRFDTGTAGGLPTFRDTSKFSLFAESNRRLPADTDHQRQGIHAHVGLGLRL